MFLNIKGYWLILLRTAFISVLTTSTGHLTKTLYTFYGWNIRELIFTWHEFNRLYLHFLHPSSCCLIDLIGRSNPTKDIASIRQLIESINNECVTCQSFKCGPLNSKASIPKHHLLFNDMIYIDWDWLDEKQVIHVIGEQKRFRNACCLKSKAATYN